MLNQFANQFYGVNHILIAYSAARVIFTMILHYDVQNERKYFVFDILFQAIFCGVALELIAHKLLNPLHQLVIIPLFFISSIMYLKWFKILREGTGTLDIVWIAVFSLTCGTYITCSNFDVMHFADIPQVNAKISYYNQYSTEIQFLFGKTIDSIFFLTTVVGVIMTIIWSGGSWRKGEEIDKNRDAVRISASITWAYIFIAFTVLFGMALPLYLRFISVKDYIINIK